MWDGHHHSHDAISPLSFDRASITAGHAIQQQVQFMMVFSLVGYATMCILCLVLLGYMRYNRHVAFRGDTSAARKIILPAFEPMLWILGGTTGVYTVFFCCAIAMAMYTDQVSRLAYECFYSGRQFVFLLVVIFMLQKSVSIPALQRAVIVTAILSAYTIPLVLVLGAVSNASNLKMCYWVLEGARAAILLLYTFVIVRPPARASKRTLREYCAFVFVYHLLVYVSDQMFFDNSATMGFTLMYVYLLWGSLCPLFMWRVVRADTEHWRGLGQRAVALQSLFRQKNNIHERISCQGLHLLIEMHRKFIIDFAYLELRERIGMGSSAVVFQGILHSKTPVAIKVYTPTTFTEDTVAEFSHEAALCGALNHPNIVKFYGMCVCPPTICLVSELCQGSIEDVTRSIAMRKQSHQRQQLLINLAYMIDAARAVAYIHSFSPAFLHRDIKPSNFLVDSEGRVKLTDFGESRSLPRMHFSDSNEVHDTKYPGLFRRSSKFAYQYYDEETQPSSPSNSPTDDEARMTVKGTADYMAPEIIKGKAGMARYGEAADVYSLAITMWDILYPGSEKFPTLKNNHLQVFECVIDGKRPALDPDLHPTLREIIDCAWQADPRLRPSAQQIVTILESIQEELALLFASELCVELDHDSLNMRHAVIVRPRNYTGQTMVERMEGLRHVASPSEAIRLGNALMDAGFLHHSKHAKSFENNDAMYHFDEDALRSSIPSTILEDSGSAGSDGGGERGSAPTSTNDQIAVLPTPETPVKNSTFRFGFDVGGNTVEGGRCPCRKLGQRLEDAKVSRRTRFRKKIKGLAEDNLLTTKLLEEDHPADAFDGFDAVARPARPA
ncbi:TPA: hypothetical protein N0F65_012285 [Lagenidium giganteum]|uniref:TKL protein kinase n=1 Tax=Lagenidium giganteum TaxID=4803 RepID=A0AAV2ZD89_9STRA|nr:TPA: hypothetical protein N0F65_012285 [Lagenidium giganteum]